MITVSIFFCITIFADIIYIIKCKNNDNKKLSKSIFDLLICLLYTSFKNIFLVFFSNYRNRDFNLGSLFFLQCRKKFFSLFFLIVRIYFKRRIYGVFLFYQIDV